MNIINKIRNIGICTIRKIGNDPRREYTLAYSFRCERERTFSIPEKIMKAENIWHTRKRSYNAAMGLKAITYNLMVISNMKAGEK